MTDVNDKKAKQRAFLAPYVLRADYTLNYGVRLLRYCCSEEVDECEKTLKQNRQTLIDIPPSKDVIKEAISGIDTIATYMTYLFAVAFFGPGCGKFDDAYAPCTDQADLTTQTDALKALEAK